MDYTVDDLMRAIEQEEQSAIGRESDSINTDRSSQIDYYLGRPYGNEIEGRSQVVSRDTLEVVEWLMPSLMRIFASGESIIKFNALGPQDEAQADQETDYVNHVIQNKNDWFNIAYTWIKDCLLTRNAYAMAYWDKEIQYSTEQYQGLTDDQLALITQDQTLQITAHSQYPAPGIAPSQQIDPMTGAAIVVPPPMLHDVVIKKIKSNGCAKIMCLPPERCMVSERTTNTCLYDAPFFEYWDLKTLSELREMGLDVPDDISDSGSTGSEMGPVDLSRNISQITRMRQDDNTVDPAVRRVKVRMVWIRFDLDGDGITETLQCICVGKQMLSVMTVDCIPVACITSIIMPHRHEGLAESDLVMDIQLIRSVMLRQIVDNTFLQNNGRYGISNKVDLDDFLTSRPGAPIRIDTENADVQGHIVPLTHPFIGSQALQIMEYMEQVRQNRTGSNQYSQGVDLNEVNKTASGIAQLTSSSSQRTELLAMIIANGMKDLFRIVHELILKHSMVEDVVRLRGKWVTIDPREWKKRDSLSISVGMAVGNKEQLIANLRMILAAQIPAMQIGVSEPRNIYETLSELTKAAGFQNPDRFWTNPEMNPPAPPQPSDVQVLAQADLQKAREKIQADISMNREDNIVDLQKKAMDIAAKDRETAVKAAKAISDAFPVVTNG